MGNRRMTDAAKISEESSGDPEMSSDDSLAYELLEQYTDLLHRGDLAACDQLMADNPELASVMKCLAGLDRLAGDELPSMVTHQTGDEFGNPQTMTRFDEPIEFGGFELLEELGRGGMGIVFRARQKDLDRIVALKMILANQFATDEEVHRFHTEARAAGSLRHPHIVGIHEVGAHLGQHYFTMDFIEGQSLAELSAQSFHHSASLQDDHKSQPLKSFDVDRIARCMRDIAQAVNFLHDNDIIHRDLKPANILVDTEGRPHVTDFGLAKVLAGGEDHTRSGQILGTPSFMAPEQAAGRAGTVTSGSDIYSLGAILYELLTGRPPFREETPLDTLVQVLEGEPMLPSHRNRQVPPELELICMKCLEKDLARRYATAEELANDLERFLKREPIAARPSGLIQKFRRWGRREPALVTHLASLGVAATVVHLSYLASTVKSEFHAPIMSLILSWAACSVLFQKLMNRESLATAIRPIWSGVDVAFLTAVLYLADEPLGPPSIGYPMLIIASGLFFRVRVVWFTTAVALIGYVYLVIHRPDDNVPIHYPYIYGGVLAIVGLVIGYQVYRVRALSQYYENRQL